MNAAQFVRKRISELDGVVADCDHTINGNVKESQRNYHARKREVAIGMRRLNVDILNSIEVRNQNKSR